MSDWTVTIVGGTIAAVLAGLILYKVLPQSGAATGTESCTASNSGPRPPGDGWQPKRHPTRGVCEWWRYRP